MLLLADTTNLTRTIWILLLQIPLLKAHLSRKFDIDRNNLSLQNRHHAYSPPTDKTPTITELFFATLIFWTIQFVCKTAAIVTDLLFANISHSTNCNLMALFKPAIWEALLTPVISTWAIYLTLHTILEFVFPAICAIYLYPSSTLQYTLSRARNLATFITPWLPPAKSHRTIQSHKRQKSKRQRTRSQSLPTGTHDSNRPNNIRLERTQSYPDSQKDPRTLDWNLVVDSLAMNEMKETLGPPGGFGELGFCVQKDRVTFECMGPGTCFNLTFRLEGDEGLDEIGGENAIISNSGKTRKQKR